MSNTTKNLSKKNNLKTTRIAALHAETSVSVKQLPLDVQRLIQSYLGDGRLLKGQLELAKNLGVISVERLDQFITTLKPIKAVNAMQASSSKALTADKSSAIVFVRQALQEG